MTIQFECHRCGESLTATEPTKPGDMVSCPACDTGILVPGRRVGRSIPITVGAIAIVVAGVLLYCHIFFHGYGISMTKAAYMMSIKRLSIVFGVIFGGLVFHEENFQMRLLGAMLMFSGAVVILLMAG